MFKKLLKKMSLVEGKKAKGLPGSAFRNQKTTTGFTQLVDFRLTKMRDIFAWKQQELFPRRKFTTGFTLIELMVVISIIALLSSIVLATLVQAREKAEITAWKEYLSQVVLAIELYKSEHVGELRNSLGNLVTTEGQALYPYIKEQKMPKFVDNGSYEPRIQEGFIFEDQSGVLPGEYRCESSDSEYYISFFSNRELDFKRIQVKDAFGSYNNMEYVDGAGYGYCVTP